ncbi:MAG: hypothetical protein WC444_02525 [Candidatus Paceibacterota bacterium]
MATPEAIKSSAISAGGEDWALLTEVVLDSGFQNLLNQQHKGLVQQLKDNPNVINGYRDYFADIIIKYIAWKIYKDTDLKKLGKNVDVLANKVQESSSDLEDLNRVAKLASGATALAAYSKTFSTTAGRHEVLANNMRNWYFIAITMLLFVIGLLFFVNISDYKFIKSHLAEDVMYNLSLVVFILKAVLAFFFFQIVQFFRKNYNAEKHLEETYRHRSDVLQSLHAVYNSIDLKDEKDKLLSAAALFAYERGETGYITTKEGAGSGDITESLFARIIK